TTVLVGFQHYLVMLGTTVLIATIITILFLSGINMLLQVHFGTRLPAVMSGSYTYIYPVVAIILSQRYALLIDPLERFVFTMRSLQGVLIIVGVFQAVVGFFGIWRVFIRFLSPLTAVPFVTLTGLGLFFSAFPGVTKCIEVGLPALVLLVIFAEYASHVFAKGSFVFSRCPVLVTVVIIWIYAEILTAAGAYNQATCLARAVGWGPRRARSRRWGSAPPSGLRPGAASTQGPPSPALWSWRVGRVGGGGAVAAGIAGTGQGQRGH
ncbi:hypothetical protein ACJX0J_027650, partial [Zea mays]